MSLSVLDYGGPTNTLAIAPAGSRVYFPAHTPYEAPPGGWQISKGLEIYGDDPGVLGADSGSVIKATGDGAPVFDILPGTTGVHFHDLQIRRDGAGAGTGVGIRCRTTQAGETAGDLTFERLYLQGFASHGIHLEGFNATDAFLEGVAVTDCLVKGCGGAGLWLVNAHDVMLMADAFTANQLNGVAALASMVALYACEFEGNCLNPSWSAAAHPYEGNLKLDACPIATAASCRFARFHLGNVRRACVLVGCGGGAVRLGNFSTEDAASGAIGILLAGAGSGPVAVIGNRYHDVPVLLDVAPDVRDLVLLPQYDVTGAGTMNLPASPNQGLFGSPQVNSGPPLSGLGMPMIIPSGSGQDLAALRPGALFYDQTAGELRVYVPGALKAVLTDA